MDGNQFDRISRALGSAATRRGGLAAALGALIGGATAATAAAKSPERPAAAGPCGNGSNKDNTCSKDGQCCTRYCADGFCRCKPNWTACTKDAHCCSGSCILGQCDGGCNPEGSRCRENFNCCSGMVCTNGRCVKSKKAACGKSNCPGCCDGTTCRVGAAKGACGTKGGRCETCSGKRTCSKGSCSAPTPPPATCNATTCPNGCCASNGCQPGTSDSACGSGGGACAACPTGKTCQAQTCATACDRTVGASIGGAVTDTTIQGAIDAAPDGGKVCIQAGTYSVDSGSYIGVITKNLAVKGDDEATVILDGLSARSAFQIGAQDYTSAITVSISNLTIQNGAGGDGGAVYAFGNSGMTVNMTDVTVKNGTGINGIYMDGGASGPVFVGARLTIDGNDVRPNLGRGGGFISYGTSTLTDCEITNNSTKSEGGGITLLTGATLTMTGGKLSGNHAYTNTAGYGNGGAFSFYADSQSPASITLTNVEVKDNVADGSGGVGYYDGTSSTVTMTGCTVSGNTGVTCNCVYHFTGSSYTCDSSYCA